VSTDAKTRQSLRAENAELRARLEEAEETLRAIRSGEVDALVVGEQIYMLESADAASNRFRGEVLAQVKDVVIAVDNDNRVKYLNPAAERQYGFDASEVLGCDLGEVLHYRWLHPDDEAAAQRALGDTGVWRGGNIHVKRNGEEIQVESTVNVLRDGGGAVTGLLAIIRDITERKRVEEEARQMTSRLDRQTRIFDTTLSSISDFAYLFDRDGRFLYSNRALTDLLGITSEAIVGKNFFDLNYPDDLAARLQKQIRQVVDAGEIVRDETPFTSPAGEPGFYEYIFTPVFAADGTTVEVVAGSTRDVTERKRWEDAFRRAHEELEARVRERTLALGEANVSLRAEVRERRAAEERVKSLLKQLVAVQEEERRRIARDIHDQMGQQMTALRMSLESLRANCDGQSELAEQFMRTLALAEELDQSVDFLTWELRPAALDHLGLSAALANLVRGWSERFRLPAEYHASGVDDLRLAPDAEINLYRLAQEALHNVYKHAGATSVGVFLERRDDHAVLIIEDDGRGFDPGGVSDGDDGERMGLVGMRERATLVGGELEVESSPGDGTTIYVRVALGIDGARGVAGDE
jgi:PAS domain S-box-containing protein